MTKYPDLLKPDLTRHVRHSSAGVSGHAEAETRQRLSAFWPRSRAKEGALMTHTKKGLGVGSTQNSSLCCECKVGTSLADWQILARGLSSVSGRGRMALHVSHLWGKPQGVARGSQKPAPETFHFSWARRRRGRERLVRKPDCMLRVVLLRYYHRRCLKTWN